MDGVPYDSGQCGAEWVAFVGWEQEDSCVVASDWVFAQVLAADCLRGPTRADLDKELSLGASAASLPQLLPHCVAPS